MVTAADFAKIAGPANQYRHKARPDVMVAARADQTLDQFLSELALAAAASGSSVEELIGLA